MILHLFLGDLYVEKFPSSLRYLKLVVKIDECREHGIASDLYLSDNIVRFNQTVHFPLNDDDAHINEIELSLVSIHTDIAENLLGFAKFVCTTGEHSITKTINLHDYRGVPVGKVPVTSFYYSSAIKLGDRVMFKPTYTPSAKEHAFLLNRRFREMHKARSPSSKPVTFNEDIEHRLNNEVRDLMSHDFKIVSSNKVKKKPAPTSKPSTDIPSSGIGKSAAKDSMTYNPGMTRNGAMSDAARGRVAPKMPIGGTKKKTKSKPKPPVHAEPPKLRTTYMSVGYVKDKQWPEKSTGANQRNLYRIQQASEMKLQILKDIALTVKQRNIRTQAKQEAIRQKKMQVDVDEGKLKRVLIRKENEIQLLKGTLTHLRLTSAMQQNDPPSRTARDKARHNSFSRLSHLTYPNPNDSSFRRSGTPNSARRASTPVPASALRSSSAGHQRRQSTPTNRVRRNSAGQNVSFFADLSRHGTPAPVLYHPMSDKKSPYDSRAKRSVPSSGYSARPSQEELVDQLSDIFDTDFQEDRANHLHPANTTAPHGQENNESILQSTYGRVGGADGSARRHIAKDWLANARASINEYHRPAGTKNSVAVTARNPPPRTVSPQGVKLSRPTSQNAHVAPVRTRGSPPASSSAAVLRVHRSQAPQQPSTAPRQQVVEETHHNYEASEETEPSRDEFEDNMHFDHHDADSSSEDERRRYQQKQNTVAVPGFLNALVDNHDVTQSGEFNAHTAEADTTVSSIAVGDIPWMPSQVSKSEPSAATNTTASTAAAASWRDVYNSHSNSAPTVVVPAVSKESQSKSGNEAEPASPDNSVHSSDSLENQSHAQQAPSKPVLQSTINYVAAASAPTGSTKPRSVSAGAAARLQRNQQYTLQSTISASSDRLAARSSHNSAGTFPAHGDQLDQVKGLMTSHRRAGEPLTTSTEQMDDFAKSQFSIRFDGTDLRVPPVRSGNSSGTKQEIVARQLEKNRRYDTSKSASAVQGTTTSTKEEQSTEPVVPSTEEDPETTTDLPNTSLSEQLQRKIRKVYESVGDLEDRVGTMKQQRKEDRVPQGWVRRSTATAASTVTTTTTTITATGGAAGASTATSTSSGTRSVTAAARNPVPAANTTTTSTSSTAKVFTTRLDDSGSPAEEDLKILFEDASSESSDSREFDLVRHKEAVAARA